MIKLIDADKKYLTEYQEAYKKSLEKISEGLMKKHQLKFVDINEVDIIQEFKDNRDKSKLTETSVPSYDYFLVDNNKFIGIIHIRLKLTKNLMRYGGNIGYAINPKYWRQGYGSEILRLGLEKAKELGLTNKVLITCDDDNIGSYKIIEKNGGILENKIENESCGEYFLTRRYWIKLYKN